MAHIARDWDSHLQDRHPGRKSIFLAARNALLRIVDRAGEDGSDLAQKKHNSQSGENASSVDKFGDEVAAHVRSVIENGYFEEETGNRVFVPWYIRSLLINEMHRHL